MRNKLWHKVGEVGATLKNPLVEGMNVFLHAGMNLSNRSQIKNRKTRHFRLVCFLTHWQSLHKSTQSQYLKLRDWQKVCGGGGGVGRSREGVGDEETVDHTCYVKHSQLELLLQ